MPVKNTPLVLLVDDDADTRELYRLVLESVGYRVEEAASVSAAGARLKDFTPAVVLTDWLLAGGNGLDVCRALAERRTTRNVPIVAVTGLTFDEARRKEAAALGVVELLVKPADPDTILAAIQAALQIGLERRLRAAAARAQRYVRLAQRVAHQQAREAAGIRPDASALLERAAARSGDHVTLMIADDTAHYVAASGATRQLTGYESSELRGLTVWDLTPLPGTMDGNGLWKQFIATGAQEGHYILRRRDGAAVEAKYCALANIAPGWHVSALSEAPHMPVTLAGG